MPSFWIERVSIMIGFGKEIEVHGYPAFPNHFLTN